MEKVRDLKESKDTSANLHLDLSYFSFALSKHVRVQEKESRNEEWEIHEFDEDIQSQNPVHKRCK